MCDRSISHPAPDARPPGPAAAITASDALFSTALARLAGDVARPAPPLRDRLIYYRLRWWFLRSALQQKAELWTVYTRIALTLLAISRRWWQVQLQHPARPVRAGAALAAGIVAGGLVLVLVLLTLAGWKGARYVG